MNLDDEDDISGRASCQSCTSFDTSVMSSEIDPLKTFIDAGECLHDLEKYFLEWNKDTSSNLI